MGPVWAYWAFPMERHCGDIGRKIRSRRFPYASISTYMTSRAQLMQVALLYNLEQELCLDTPVTNDRDFKLPLCTFVICSMYLHAHCGGLDPLYALSRRKRTATTLSTSMWMTITATLATRFNKSASVIRRLIPKETRFVQYGRACRLDGGDIIHASQLNSVKPDSRDMSFVRVCRSLTHLLSMLNSCI